MKKNLSLLILLCLVTTVLGCETLKGAAKDIENTGKNIGDVLTRSNN